MYIYIKMQAPKKRELNLSIPLPLLPGSVSTATSTCGKPQCACKARPPKLHGVYYRWTGFLAGKRTTKTLTKEQAQECQRRIKNYRKLQQQIQKIVTQALAKAPWNIPSKSGQAC
jgi:hypothetical protein